jgi:hypothetical protein
MSEEKVFPDFEPETVTLKGTTKNDKVISAEFYTNGDSILSTSYISMSGAKIALTTHIRCERCGKVVKKNKYYSRNTCDECSNIQEHEKYLQKPLVDLKFPIFINDDFIVDEEALDDYLYVKEITSEEGLEIHNTKPVKVTVDIFEYLNGLLEDVDYEEDLQTISKEKYQFIAEQEKAIQEIVDSLPTTYDCDTKTRTSIQKYLKGEH